MGNNSVTGVQLDDAKFRMRQIQSLLHSMEASAKTPYFELICTDLFNLADELIDEVIYSICAGDSSSNEKEETA